MAVPLYSSNGVDTSPVAMSPRSTTPTWTPTNKMYSSSSDFQVVQRSPNSSLIATPLQSDVLLLLTPVIVSDSQRPLEKDPFEVLGRLLSKKHPRIRHVPYIPRLGLTDTHRSFLREASTVVFVVNDSISMKQEIHQLPELYANDKRHSRRAIQKPFVVLQYAPKDIKLRNDSPREYLGETNGPSEEDCLAARDLILGQ